MGGRLCARIFSAVVVALLALCALAPGAPAYRQYAPCASDDGTHTAGVIFHVRNGKVRWVQLKMSGGKRSKGNHARYGQSVWDKNGEPGIDMDGSNLIVLVDWPFPNDGRWHARKYAPLEDGSPSTTPVFPQPWGWEKHWSGEWLYYQPWVVFEWADGAACQATSLPPKPPPR
jgi:hypothetical protein